MPFALTKKFLHIARAEIAMCKGDYISVKMPLSFVNICAVVYAFSPIKMQFAFRDQDAKLAFIL